MNETQRMYEAMRIVDANDGLLTHNDADWTFFQYESRIDGLEGGIQVSAYLTTNVEWIDESQRFESF